MSSDRPAATAREAARIPVARAGASTGPVGELAGYEVLAELGRGAQSTVYRVRRPLPPQPRSGARDKTGGPPAPALYALKILDRTLADSETTLVAFRREAALLASVNHPGLTRVHEVGVADGRPYLVMDLVDGVPLSEVLAGAPGPASGSTASGTDDAERHDTELWGEPDASAGSRATGAGDTDGPTGTAGRRMAADQVIALGLDIVGPLAAVHRTGLVHRDLKPPNIMVLADGEARLIDFGLTTREGAGEAPSAVGTLAYSAPEQSGMLKRPVDNRSDLYSLGVILFEALAGRLPFPTGDVGELLRMHAVVPPPDLRDVAPDCPPDLAEVVARLLAKDPDDRYQSGEALAEDLYALTGGTRDGAPGTGAPGTGVPGSSGAGIGGVGGGLGAGRRWAAERPAGEPPALSGRDRELAELTERWERARAGAGGVAMLRGAAGTGKSALALTVAGLAGAGGATILRGKASADDPVPFAPLRAALEEYLQSVVRMPVKDRWRQRARIRGACAGWSAAMLGRLAPTLEGILNGRDTATGPVPTPDRSRDPGSPRDQDRNQDRHQDRNQDRNQDQDDDESAIEGADGQNQFAAAVAGFLAGLARENGGLVLLLEDVQWLDLGSRRVLAHLAGELASTPLLVLATARDDDESLSGVTDFVTSMGRSLDVDRRLGPLDEAGVGAQITALMPGLSVDARLVTLLHVRSNGNPFVVQEYLRAVVDAGLLQPSWGSWVLDEAGLDALELPQDAVGLVLARVGELGPQVRELLIAAAAIGSRFRTEALIPVSGLAEADVLTGLNEAARHRLVEPREGGGFAFLHDRIREALLADLDPDAASDLHRRIAQALEALPVPTGGRPAEEVYAVAHHYMLCAPGVAADRVLATCWAAGKLALDNHAPGDAVLFLEHAAGLGIRRPSGLLLLLGSAFQQSGRLTEAREQLEAALEVETTLLRRADIFTLLAGVHRSSWDSDAALEAISRGLAELGARLPRNRVTLALSTLLMFLSAVFRQRTGIGFGTATGLRREHARAISALHEVGSYLGVISMRRDLVLVHDLRALYWTTRLGPGRRYAISQANFGVVCDMAGLHRTAARAFARADADPATANPAVRALIAHYRGAGRYLGDQDDSTGWMKATEANGRWLDVATYLDAVAVFTLNACTAGRTRDAEYWLAQGQRRLGSRPGQGGQAGQLGFGAAAGGRAAGVDVTSFIGAAPQTHALQGRFGESGTELRRLNDLCAPYAARSLAVIRLVTSLFALIEQGDLGAPFEQAVAEFEALGIPPNDLLRVHRIIPFQIALGRLAQLRGTDPEADPQQHQARLDVARAAVQLAQKVTGPQELTSRALLVRADLLVAEGSPARALDLLSAVPLVHAPDAPTLSFELARSRARALHALGLAHADEARRQALLASTIASDQHWPHRRAAVAAEFGLVAPDRASVSVPVSQAGTYTGGLERQRLQALQQVSAAASRVLDPGELARIALDETIRILAADRAFLFLVDTATGGLVSYLGRDSSGQDVPELTGYSTSLVERVRSSGQPLVVTGTEEGAALGAQSVVLHGLRSIMAAPLQLEGRVLGVVYLDSQVAKGIFTADDAGILNALTNHIATSLETARAAQLEISMQTAQRQRDLAETLNQTLQTMSETFEPNEVIKRLLAAATQVVSCDDAWLLSTDDSRCLLLRADPDGGELVQDPVPGDPLLDLLLGREQPSVGTVDALPAGLADRLAGATSWIALPLQSRKATLRVLVLVSHAPGANLADDVEVAAALATQGMTAYDKAVLFKEVEELAVADDLTGIANRRRFFEVAARDLAAALRHERPLTALMVDIDHFKRVNDTYGHATGDDVIRTVAARLSGQVRQTDILGRYGGEEFALLLQDAGPGNDLPERLRACVADAQITTRSGPVKVTVSIGLAYLTREDTDIVAFLARADEALYRAKDEGRNRVCVAAGPPDGSSLPEVSVHTP